MFGLYFACLIVGVVGMLASMQAPKIKEDTNFDVVLLLTLTFMIIFGAINSAIYLLV